MTIYKKTGSEWPVQQSVTEQKFKNGLFTVSAEFIRPAGEVELPTIIETSIGAVGVGGIDPTITKGTDGMERIQVVAYDIWNASAIEERISLTPMTIELQARTINACGGEAQFQVFSKVINIFAENMFKHFPGINLPPEPQLNIFGISNNGGLVNISNHSYNVTTLFGITSKTYSGNFQPQQVDLQIFPQSITRHHYGEVVTTEVVYSILPPAINFGIFDLTCPPPP